MADDLVHTTVRYIGLDVSAAAIDLARKRGLPNASFLKTDAETYCPEEPFDVIVFNECMYYMEDPYAILSKFAGFLRPNGLFVVSMYSTGSTRKVWRLLANGTHVLHHVSIWTNKRKSWDVKVLELIEPPRGRDVDDG